MEFENPKNMKFYVVILLIFLLTPRTGISQCGITHSVDTSAMFGFEITFDFSALADPSQGSAEIYIYDRNENIQDLGYADNQWPTFTTLIPLSNGNYTYNGVVTDTATACQDSIFGSFTVLNQPGGFDCDPVFSYTSDSLNMDWEFFSTAAYNPPSCTYKWVVGGSPMLFGNPLMHTYQSQVITERWISVNVESSDCLYGNAMAFDTIVSGYLLECSASFDIFPDTSNSSNIWAYNTSYGGFISHFWDFGDGGTSTQQFPTYLYTTPGQYNLCLTVDDTSGCQSTFCDTIDVVVKKVSGTTLNVLDPNSSSSVNELGFEEFELYPNPNSGKCYFSFDSRLNGFADFVLIDIKGVEVYRKTIFYEIGKNSESIEVYGLDPGLYFYQLDERKGRLIID